MKVKKRDGRLEDVKLEKITKRVNSMAKGLDNVEPMVVSQRVISGLFDGVTTRELDELAVKTAANLSTTHPDYDCLAARLSINMIHKETKTDFAETMEALYNRRDEHGNHRPLVHENFIKVVRKHKQAINAEIIYRRDYDFDYLGVETLKRAYLSKLKGKIIERPQHMWMRVSLGIHGFDLESAFDTYEKMSKKLMTHATPTLFNAGTINENLISCYLLHMDSDSIKGIYKTLTDCAKISKMAGGIGVHIHNIRSAGASIYGTGGISNGLVPMLKVFDSTANYVDQGGGRRKGSFAMYLTVNHPDIFEFLDLKKNTGKDELRSRHLFYGLWIPDIFMKRVKENGKWTLMDPMACPGLEEVYGDEYEKLYLKYESEGKGQRTISAHELFRKILETQIETSMPYMLYKDSVNMKSNQKNIGTIKSSNLCSEIVEFTSPNEIAACLTADTKILTKDGLRNIIDCDGKEIFVPFETDLCKKKNSRFVKAKLLSQGIKKVFKVKTKSGYAIKATSNHLILIRDKINYNSHEEKYIWKEVGELKKGDKISTPALNISVQKFEDFNPKQKSKARTYTEVICVEELGEENVYDLSLLEGNHFVANGLIVHNCNLASLALPMYVEGERRIRFNHKKLHAVAKRAVYNLNKVINVNKYPVKEAQISNFRHRPIGLGVQGLADVFIKMKINWDSEEAYKLNSEIFETVYHAALEASIEDAIKDGPYSTWEGCPASQGKLQYDLWFDDIKNRYPLFKDRTFYNWKDPSSCETAEEYYCSSRYDWADLKEKIREHGLRNSLLIALMPTASTASILGNTESFEPIPSNIYKRNVLSGEFIRVNKYLVEILQKLNLWNDRMKQRIIAAEGSVQYIEEIPEDVRKLFRTVWELPQKALVELSAARGAFICQSQSFNIYFKDATFRKLSSAHYHGWLMGLKTGSYYIRQQASRQAQKFTVDVEIEKEVTQTRNDEADYQNARKILLERGFTEENLNEWDRKTIIDNGKGACSLDNLDNPDDCLMCGS